MKIRILKGTTLHGKAVAAGEVLEVGPGDYYNLLEYKLCEQIVEAPQPILTTSMPEEKVSKRAKGK